MKGSMQFFFVLWIVALFAVTDARNTSRARGRRAQQIDADALLESFGSEFADAARKSRSSDDFLDDFDDNSRGYCKLKKLDEIALLDSLTKTPVEESDNFMYMSVYDGVPYEEATKELREFVKLARKYLPKDLEKVTEDRKILESIMQMNYQGESRILTSECIEAIDEVFFKSLDIFHALMNNGESFVAPNDAPLDSAQHHPVSTRQYTVLLDVLEDGIAAGDTFQTFIALILHYYMVFNAEVYFNRDWLKKVRSWQEMALSPVSIMAKYSAVFLAMGEQLKAEFPAEVMDTDLEKDYQGAVDKCYAPTQMPSSAPSLSPEGANKQLTVVAVMDIVASDVTQKEMDDSWELFRMRYEDRHFCLLQVLGRDPEELKVPKAFMASNMTSYAKINIDYDEAYDQSDWYDLCKLYDAKDAGIGIIPLFIKTSNVGASLALFNRVADGEGQVVVEVEEKNLASSAKPVSSTNWIDPFTKDFN